MIKKIIPWSKLFFLIAFLISLCGETIAGENSVPEIRKEHPRLFINKEMLPALRKRAQNDAADYFTKIKTEVDNLPLYPPSVFKPNAVQRNEDGSLKVSPGGQGQDLFQYNGGDQAVMAALVYLITGKKEYLEKAKKYLMLATYLFQWTAENNIWVDMTGNVRINAMAAYDWIYNDLTQDERIAFASPLLNYIKDAQSSGPYKFRRTIGNEKDGNYGESALRYFAGLATYGDGVNDSLANSFLQDGTKLFIGMMDFRDRLSDGSGLLTSPSAGYTFGHYPYSTFLFLHSWYAAFGEDISGRWNQMENYPAWYDSMMIRGGTGAPFTLGTFGIGDVYHRTNGFGPWLMYTHIAQSIHFYGGKNPEKASYAYSVLNELPSRMKEFTMTYPFIPLLLSNFNPKLVKENRKKEDKLPRYFFNQPFGLLLMRSGNTAEDTYASFRFGSSQVTHQHYDELSFVIYKNGFLALDAGSRTEVDHHHAFAPQSVAHNTILIHEDQEPLAEFWKSWSFKDDGNTYYNHGGQAFRNRGKSIALRSNDSFIYAAGDATRSYIPEKSKEVVRQFVYIKPDIFVVYDRVESTRSDQKKEILFHFQNKPEEVDPQSFVSNNGGSLYVTSLLPKNAAIKIEGGEGREFWASDRNWPLEGGGKWKEEFQVAGGWRIEVSPKASVKRTNFLTMLQATGSKKSKRIVPELFSDDTQDGIRLTDDKGVKWEMLFSRSGTVTVNIRQYASNGTLVFEENIEPKIEKMP